MLAHIAQFKKEYALLQEENEKLAKANLELTKALEVANDELGRADEEEARLRLDIEELENQLIECQDELDDYKGAAHSDYYKQVVSDYNKGRV